ncbi:MAG: hypothetical protein HYY93_08810 [Planctomycetes bacterium]|nr:hypothetical protein [Planctomycetota bacterium]
MNARQGMRLGQWTMIAVAVSSLVWFAESGGGDTRSSATRGSLRTAEAQQNLTGIVDLPRDHTNLSQPGNTWLGSSTGGGSNGGQLGYFPWRGADLTSNGYSTSIFLLKPDELLNTGDLGGIAWQYVANTQGGGDHDVSSAAVTYNAFIRIGRARSGWGSLVPALELNFDDNFNVDYVLKATGASSPLPGVVPSNSSWGSISHSGGALFGFQSIGFNYILPDYNVPYVLEVITGGSTPSPTTTSTVGANTYSGNQNGYQHAHPGGTSEFVDAGGWELNTTSTNVSSWGFASSSSVNFPPTQGTISPDKFPTLRLLFVSKLTSSGGNKLHGGGGGSCFVNSTARPPAAMEADSFAGFRSRLALADGRGGTGGTVIGGTSPSAGLSEALRESGGRSPGAGAAVAGAIVLILGAGWVAVRRL